MAELPEIQYPGVYTLSRAQQNVANVPMQISPPARTNVVPTVSTSFNQIQVPMQISPPAPISPIVYPRINQVFSPIGAISTPQPGVSRIISPTGITPVFPPYQPEISEAGPMNISPASPRSVSRIIPTSPGPMNISPASPRLALPSREIRSQDFNPQLLEIITNRFHNFGYQLIPPPNDLPEPEYLELHVAKLLTNLGLKYLRESQVLDTHDGHRNLELSPYDFLIAAPHATINTVIFAIIELDGRHHFRPRDYTPTKVFESMFELDYDLFTTAATDAVLVPPETAYIRDIQQRARPFFEQSQLSAAEFANQWNRSRDSMQRQIDIDRHKTRVCLNCQIPFLRISGGDAGKGYTLVQRIVETFVKVITNGPVSNPLVVYSDFPRYWHLIPNRDQDRIWFWNLKQLQAAANLPQKILPLYDDRMELEAERAQLNFWLSQYPLSENKIIESRIWS